MEMTGNTLLPYVSYEIIVPVIPNYMYIEIQIGENLPLKK